MRVAIYLIAALFLSGCATADYNQRHNLAVKSLSEGWNACVDARASEWLRNLDWNSPEEVKRLQNVLNRGQMFIRVLDQCRDHVAGKNQERSDLLNNRELKAFILQAQKRFRKTADAIDEQSNLEGL